MLRCLLAVLLLPPQLSLLLLVCLEQQDVAAGECSRAAARC